MPYHFLSQTRPWAWTLVVLEGIWWATPAELKVGLRNLEHKTERMKSQRTAAGTFLPVSSF